MIKIVHENSIVAFHSLDTSERRRLVLSVYQNAPDDAFTDRQVANRLGYSDMNCVRPRISELIDEGVLIEMGKVRDFTTHKTVRLVRIRKTELQQELFK